MKSLIVLCVFLLLVSSGTAAEQTYDFGYVPKPPAPFPPEYKNFQILPDTISPDQRYAFIYTKRSLLYELEDYRLFLVALQPFRILSRVAIGDSSLAQSGRSYYAASWTKDASTTVFLAGSRWGPEKVWVLQLRDGKVAKRTELTKVVRQQVLPDYEKAHAGRYNEYYDFVFDEDHENTSGWKLDDSGHVMIDTTCTTDPKELEPHRWAVRFKGTWDIAAAKLIERSVSRIPPRPNQAMQLTAPRSVFPPRVAITFNLRPRALPGAVADLGSRSATSHA